MTDAIESVSKRVRVLEGAGGVQGEPGPQGVPGQPGPQGVPGQDGTTGDDGKDADEMLMGSVTTGLPGSDATVEFYTLENTPGFKYLEFTIPRGDKGEQGNQGIPGTNGADAVLVATITSLNFVNYVGNPAFEIPIQLVVETDNVPTSSTYYLRQPSWHLVQSETLFGGPALSGEINTTFDPVATLGVSSDQKSGFFMETYAGIMQYGNEELPVGTVSEEIPVVITSGYGLDSVPFIRIVGFSNIFKAGYWKLKDTGQRFSLIKDGARYFRLERLETKVTADADTLLLKANTADLYQNVSSISSALNTDLTLVAPGTGAVRINDNLSVTGSSSFSGGFTANGSTAFNSGGIFAADLKMFGASITTYGPNEDLNLIAIGTGVVRIQDSASISGGLDMKSSAVTNCSTVAVQGKLSHYTSINPFVDVQSTLFKAISPAAAYSLAGVVDRFPIPGVGLGSRAFPANFLGDGMCVRMSMGGLLTNSNNPAITLTLQFRNTADSVYTPVATLPATIPAVAVNGTRFSIVSTFTIGGPTGIAFGNLVFTHGTSGQTISSYPLTVGANLISRAISWEPNFVWRHSSNNSTASITVQDFTLELL